MKENFLTEHSCPDEQGGRRMQRLMTMALLLCLLYPSVRAATRDDFTLTLSLTIGERSRDSHAETITFKLTGETLSYEQSYSGYGASSHEPIRQEFKLKGDEIGRLKSLIKKRNLLGSGVLNFEPARGQFAYFAMNIKITLDGIIATQEVSGPRSSGDITQERVYQKSVALLQELHRLVVLRNPQIKYQEPVG